MFGLEQDLCQVVGSTQVLRALGVEPSWNVSGHPNWWSRQA